MTEMMEKLWGKAGVDKMSTSTFDRKIAISSVKDLQRLRDFLEVDVSVRVLNKPIFTDEDRKEIDEKLAQYLRKTEFKEEFTNDC